MAIRRTRLFGAVALALAVALAAMPPRAQGDIFVFKDGFTIRGRLKEKTEIVDGILMNKSGEPIWIDDGYRNIYFSPGQLKEAVSDKSKKYDADQDLKNNKSNAREPMPLNWIIDSATEWNSKWEREVKLRTPQGVPFKNTYIQRITSLTPEQVRIDFTGNALSSYYHIKEIDPAKLRDLLNMYFAKNSKKDSDLERRIKVYRFLLQAGFVEQAEQEADEMLRESPMEQSKIAPLKDAVKRLQAVELVIGLERSQQAGLHADVEKKLKTYADRKLDDLLDEKAQLRVQAVKEKFEGTRRKQLEAARLVKAFADITPPSKRALFQQAAAEIIKELNLDTVERLEIFINVANDYELAVNEKRQPEQNAAEVMAFALTGWLRGSDAAERNPDVAVQQWQTRQLVLNYLRSDDPLARKNKFLRALMDAKVSVDETMQIIRRLPPVDPHENFTSKPQSMQTKNNGKPFSYELQLPPGYNHGRAWPVLIALHHGEEKAAGALWPWAELAAQHGYIVVAPEWGKGNKLPNQINGQEYEAVRETLRDLRRRFQIDSDRVFLFGCEQGGIVAYDVGLSHPDQFAGVIPMSAPPIVRRYWTNAQYLNLYVVNGDRAIHNFLNNQGAPAQETYSKLTLEMFKDFIHGNYPATYFDYKGRSNEWFGAERAPIFDWMNRKRRAHPLKEMGRDGEPFRSMRPSDNQFYWLSTSELKLVAGQQSTMRATVSNSTNEIHVRTSRIGRITIWFEPSLVDYSKKVAIRRDDGTRSMIMVVPNLDTLLERLYETGDRQRLSFAKLEI